MQRHFLGVWAVRGSRGKDEAFVPGEGLDRGFEYDGRDLGARCGERGTVFKTWSPFAQRVVLRLYKDGETAAFLQKEMEREPAGVWKLEFSENMHGVYYDYIVRHGGRDVRTADPYAKGCGCNGRRSMAVDLSRTNPPGFESDKRPEPGTEQIIYELHVKDFSYDVDSGVPEAYRGRYKAFAVRGEKGLPLCMEHLKSLGVTHVQLLPFFDYASVDEAGGEEQFNWGYDPLNYNVPEGSYSTDPHDGLVRIRECKEMIQTLHQCGIGVIMDVVYNHTYSGDSWLERMVPGYYYRRTEDGGFWDGSGCGNDIAAGRVMVDRYIVDSVLYWAREYHVDGFRFDLMGLLTVELMNRIRRELDKEFGRGRILLYGEPWRAKESPMEKGTKPALKENAALLDEGVGFFCDDTRDAIKGHVFHAEEPGFVNGGKRLEKKILHAVVGWRDKDAGFRPRSCRQIVNYVSVHDNFTLWDKLVLTMHREEFKTDGEDCFTRPYEDVLAANRLAAFIYFTCQGNLLMQAGEEFARTKLGEHNSYRSAPELNMLRWRQVGDFSDLVDYYKGLIRLRKKLPGLCDKKPGAFRRIYNREILAPGVVSFQVDNRSSAGTEWDTLRVVYNGSGEKYALALPGDGGNWEILADGREADCRRPVEASGGLLWVEARSGMLVGRSGGGGTERGAGESCSVTP